MRKLIVILNTMIARGEKWDSHTIPDGLTSAPIMRSDRGRSPVYFNNPVAPFSRGPTKMQTSGAMCREIAKSYSVVIVRQRAARTRAR
jgi:hypothetical protein